MTMTGDRPQSGRGIVPARVLVNRSVCVDHFAMVLEVDRFCPSRPGQFVNVQCGLTEPISHDTPLAWPDNAWPKPSGPELAGRQALLRRPFSLAGRRDRPDGKVELDIIHHIVGVGTVWLAQAPPGTRLSVMGPLGNGFRILPDRPVAALLGGGVGIPPMLYLAESLQAAGKQTVAFAGARTAALLPLTLEQSEPPSQSGWPTMCTAEFAGRGTPTAIATDDGSLGATGFVHQAFVNWLDQRGPAPEQLAVYACGPAPMIRAVAEVCLRRSIPCQLALERHMACGIGTCQGCVCKTKADSAEGWQYKLVCTDGPVFDADELVW